MHETRLFINNFKSCFKSHTGERFLLMFLYTICVQLAALILNLVNELVSEMVCVVLVVQSHTADADERTAAAPFALVPFPRTANNLSEFSVPVWACKHVWRVPENHSNGLLCANVHYVSYNTFFYLYNVYH